MIRFTPADVAKLARIIRLKRLYDRVVRVRDRAENRMLAARKRVEEIDAYLAKIHRGINAAQSPICAKLVAAGLKPHTDPDHFDDPTAITVTIDGTAYVLVLHRIEEKKGEPSLWLEWLRPAASVA